MLKVSTIFLQATVLLTGLVALAILIYFPLTEGRATNLDVFSIYIDPFILYAYVASLAFFVALYKAFILLSYIRKNTVFTANAARALRNIKHCAITLSVSIVAAGVFIRFTHDKADDPAGFLAISIVMAFVALVVATATAILEKLLQDAIEMKSRID
ncbi:MAG: DUF2975 domain-containing protein [Bacteroidetes bacterium]|nr:DUF2975 domain-containing protein [Bacteroidota bacterium]